MHPAQPLIDLTIVFVGVVLFLQVWRLRAYWWHPHRVLRLVGKNPVRRYDGVVWSWSIVGVAALVMTASFLTLLGTLGSGDMISDIFPSASPEELAHLSVAAFDLIVHGASLSAIGAALTDTARTCLRWKWPRRVVMLLTSLLSLAGGVYASIFIGVVILR